MTILVAGAAVARALCGRGDHLIGVDCFTPYYPVQSKHYRGADVSAGAGDCFTFMEADLADETALEAALAGHDIDRIVQLGA